MPELEAQPEKQEGSLTERRRAAGRIKDLTAAMDNLPEAEQGGWRVRQTEKTIELDRHTEKQAFGRKASRTIDLDNGTQQTERLIIEPIVEESPFFTKNQSIGSEATYTREIVEPAKDGATGPKFISGEYVVIDMAGGIVTGPMKPHPFGHGAIEGDVKLSLEPTDPRADDEFKRVLGRLQTDVEQDAQSS